MLPQVSGCFAESLAESLKIAVAAVTSIATWSALKSGPSQPRIGQNIGSQAQHLSSASEP